MSSFGGHMREYIDISLDRFDGENLDSTVYFLSHKHEDHMVGLSSNNFLYRLQSNSHMKLYCSDVTRDLLLADQRFTGLAKSLVVQELEVPFSLPVPDPTTGKVKYHVTVTMIPASHCPGSVMFLFEGSEGTALYTGDFRLARGDIARVESLRSGNSPKPIDSLYIDTTFCVPEAFFIPSREDCVMAVIDVVRDWTSISPDHMVLIYHRAALGYEHLFNHLADHFNTKVHLSDSKYAQCQKVKVLSNFGTCDGSSTQIHACKWSEAKVRHKSALPCGYIPKSGSKLHVKVITVSTMWFTQNVGMEEIVVPSKKNRSRHLRACYSFHSSFSEVRDVVMYLNPRRVFPNVIPMGHNEQQIQDRLNNFLKLASTGKPPSTPAKPCLLGKQRPTLKRPHKMSNSQSTDSDLFFDDSPVKTKKQRKSKDEDDKKDDEEANLELKLDGSQSTADPNSQPTLDGPAESEVDSSYLGSQRSTASAMDLVATDFDLTPKKQTPPNEVQSTPESIECVGEVPKGGAAGVPVTPTTNGVLGDDTQEHSNDLFSEEEKEMDQEVLSAREAFKPYKDGSYGSHVTYASDVDLSDTSDEGGESSEVNGDKGKGGTCETTKEHQSKCQKGESCAKTKEHEGKTLNGVHTEKHSSNVSDSTEAELGKQTTSAAMQSSDKQEPCTKSSDKSLVEEQGKNKPKESSDNNVKKDNADDDDDDVIMLDSDVIEEGEVTGALESVSEHEEVVTTEPQPSTSKVQEVIDLTADDDEKADEEEDDDIVSMGVRRFYREDGDGYHGDSESEDNDTDGIMADSDGSFAKASYEKTKTRMSNGKSRRASTMNGYSSSDSDSDTDVTIDESPARFPIAGSCHFSRTRLNGFHSTLVDTEVIVLDDQDDDPPPNVTVVDIASKEQEAAEKSKASLASAEDLVSGAMEMASAATAANSRLVSTIQRLRTNVSKPVLSSQPNLGDGLKHTARKSTSGPRVVSSTATKTSPTKNKVVVHKVQEAGDSGAGKCTKIDTEICDIAPSETAVVSKDVGEIGHNDSISKHSDSGNIDEIDSKQGTSLKDSPSEVLTR